MSAEFDEYADSYGDAVDRSVAFVGKDVDHYARRKVDHLLDLVQRRLGDPGRISAVDVGCGVGITDSFLAGRLGVLHGVDTAADAVERAATRNPSVRYQVYDGVELPFPDGELDLAFAICVAHHVSPGERPAFAAELHRVVRPGGMVVLFEHNPLNPLTRIAVSRCEFDKGVTLLTRGHASALLAGAGLLLAERRFIVFLPLEGPTAQRVDRVLRQVPFGAQHYVAAHRPLVGSAGQGATLGGLDGGLDSGGGE